MLLQNGDQVFDIGDQYFDRFMTGYILPSNHKALVGNWANAGLMSPRIKPLNTRRWPNAGLMLGQRRRRWANINSALGQRLVFAGNCRVQ